jgi:hypothetical protein
VRPPSRLGADIGIEYPQPILATTREKSSSKSSRSEPRDLQSPRPLVIDCSAGWVAAQMATSLSNTAGCCWAGSRPRRIINGRPTLSAHSPVQVGAQISLVLGIYKALKLLFADDASRVRRLKFANTDPLVSASEARSIACSAAAHRPH